MKIDVSKFGKMLISRPQGREAFLSSRAYIVPDDKDELIELDFSQVHVATPSWMDEFVSGLEEECGFKRVKVLPTGNASIRLSLKTIRLK